MADKWGVGHKLAAWVAGDNLEEAGDMLAVADDNLVVSLAGYIPFAGSS